MLTRRHFIASGAAGLVATTTKAAQPLSVEDRFKVQLVSIRNSIPKGEIHVTPWNHFLYLSLGDGQAIRYGVAVGAEGRNFAGEAVVARKAEWPRWTPTPSMIEREPEKYAPWANGMPGGPRNPLGARALYLYQNGVDTLYRIHGTPEPWTIGSSVSSGCVRLVNPHVEHLYRRVPVGSKVIVHAA